MPRPRCSTRSRPSQTEGVEEDLAGGVANAGQVSRENGHVLRPSNPYSASIHEFLSALGAAGFERASQPVAIQDDGRGGV